MWEKTTTKKGGNGETRGQMHYKVDDCEKRQLFKIEVTR